MKITSVLNSSNTDKRQPSSSGDDGSIEKRIRQLAYQLYEERGRHDGNHEEDWAEAEEQIRHEQGFDKVA